jgi:predicted aspartyl protease
VTGEDQGRAVMLESLEVGEARVAPILVLAYELRLQDGEGEGLLGRDFLERFDMRIDMEGQVVILSPR